MASFIYNNAVKAMITGDIDFDGTGEDTFKIALLSGTAQSTSTEKVNYDFRDDVTTELSTGNGYTGAKATTPTVSVDGNNIEVDFSSVNWTSATISATGAIIYVDNGSAATDVLVAYLDFGGTVSSTDGTFTVSITSPLTIAN